jgi:carboxymethylenebutenolidase
VAAGEHPFGYLAHPDEGAHPGVVMISDVWGLADHTRDLARRLAAEGFAVLAVDIYRKTGKGEFATPPEAMAWIAGLSDPLVLETVQEAIDALAGHPSATGKVGVTGFCMGGQYALLAACGCSGLSACAPFYGMLRYAEGLEPAKKPRSPLEALADLQCPVEGFYGEQDAIIPVADVEALREALAAGGPGGTVHLYAEAGHAFMNDTRAELYRPEAAADAWSHLVPFLRSRLA